MSAHKSTVLAIVLVLLTAGALWYTSRAVTPKEVSWEEVLAEGKNGGYRLITTEELAELYQRDAGSLLLIDTRQEWEFRTGHIAGAVNFPMEPTAWARWSKAKELEEFLGPDRGRTLVFS
jgi:3-mercaptopyruvate sulfurtransferase SseA